MLRLVLPILIPSWRFFETVDPSPRIEWSIAHSKRWSEVRPRPRRIGWRARLISLFWNPERNEALFLVSLAERLNANANQRTVRLLERRIDLALGDAAEAPKQFQLRLVEADFESIGYVSRAWTPK